MHKLANEGKLPNIKNYLIDQGSFSKGTTCFPSTTGPAYLPFLTGAFPGDHHITGIRWFDKATYLTKGRFAREGMRSYCGYEAAYFNSDMNPEYPSLFEIYPDGINIYNMITRGVQKENDITRKEKSGLYFKAHFFHRHHQVDLFGHNRLMASLKHQAPFTFAVFPSIDWDSHTYHYDDPETTHKAYRIVDESLGELVQTLKRNNTYEESLIIMASDHGLSATHTHFDLGSFFKAHRYKVLEYPQLFKYKPTVAISISGNSFASISFLDHPGKYFRDALMANHGKVVNQLLKNPAIDFALINRNLGEYVVLNNNGEALIRVSEDKISYHPVSSDVFGIGEISSPLDYHQSLHRTFESDYPDCLWQCHQLMKSHRAGDLILSASPGFDLRDFWEYPEHRGSHGSLHWEHMHVPVLTNKKNLLNGPLRTIEIHSLIKNWLASS